jgi:stage III sporulation protein AG
MIKKLKKEQWVIGFLMAILVLVIMIPVPEKRAQEEVSGKENKVNSLEGQGDSLEKQLQAILQKIAGVGKVEVLITYEDKGRVIVEKDESVSEELVQEADSGGGTRTTTTSKNEEKAVYGNSENPYVVQELSPKVKGVLVVAEGGGNLSVKKQIQETIEALFGLDTHKISIMKMEVSN